MTTDQKQGVRPERFESGQRIILDVNLYRGNKNIKIHPSSYAKFPACLPKGSRGAVDDDSKGELFVKFMIAEPKDLEQEFLGDNTVYLTLPLDMRGSVRKQIG